MKIQWNKVTWYSKFIALVLFVALPFVGFYYGTQYGEIVQFLGQSAPFGISTTSTVTTSGGGGTAYYNDISEWQTDSNNSAFSVAYPIDFDAEDNNSIAPTTNWSVNSNNEPGNLYFTLTVPKAFEPQTNLADVTFTIGGSKDDSAISQCLIGGANGGPTMATSTTQINGTEFTMFHSSDVGAGNYYETTSYRTVHAGECYAIEYTIHSSQIENYPSSYNLQPFDEAKITSLMQNIVGTFKFL